VPTSLFKRRSRPIITSIKKEIPNRTPHLLITVFGDAIQPHGGEVWLGSLIRLLQPLGINERLVRTSVYRLTQDEWFESTKVGRKSFYRLTRSAACSVASAERRIYYAPEKAWNGKWDLIFTGTAGITREQRAELRKRLSWLGFGTIATNVFGHPSASLDPVWELFETLGVKGQAAVMRAQNIGNDYGLGTEEMVRQCFNLEALEKEYKGFIKRYRRLADAIEEESDLSDESPEHCFMLRTMLVHQFRRLLLRDPLLPTPLLPERWAGTEAQQLCAFIYKAIAPQAERYIIETCENQQGAFRPMLRKYRQRFCK